jgi:hypothetical protein
VRAEAGEKWNVVIPAAFNSRRAGQAGIHFDLALLQTALKEETGFPLARE